MKHERSPRSEHLDARTLPDGTADRSPSDPASKSPRPADGNADSHVNEPSAPGEERDKNFWRFDFHTIPPDLSRELATAQLPPVREEQLYRSKAWRNPSASPEAPRSSGVAAFAARLRAWFGGPWYLRERRTQLALIFCVACLVLFVIAVGVGSNERARVLPPSVGPTQVYAASPVAEGKPGSQVSVSTAAGSTRVTDVLAPPSSASAPPASVAHPGGTPSVRAAIRAATPAPPASVKSVAPLERPQMERAGSEPPAPPATDQTSPPSSSAEPPKNPTPSAPASSAPKQRFLIKSR